MARVDLASLLPRVAQQCSVIHVPNQADSGGLARTTNQAAYRLYPRSPAFRNTFLRGAKAAVDGLPVSKCPYPVKRNASWASAYRKAWLRGYQSVSLS